MITCPYCSSEAKLVGGDVIYPHRSDLQAKRFWLCAPCDAYVGCHGDTTQPFGRLADRELRQAKMDAHAAFDRIWRARDKRNRPQTRREAYAWLAKQLGIEREQCHIGMFDVQTCQRVVEVCKERAIHG